MKMLMESFKLPVQIYISENVKNAISALYYINFITLLFNIIQYTLGIITYILTVLGIKYHIVTTYIHT